MKRWTELRVPVTTGADTTALVYRAEGNATATLVLAHGAGAGQRHPFMVAAAEAIAGLGVDVVTFNFLYTEQKRRVPDRAPLLESCYRRVVEQVRIDVPSARRGLVIGGKSMGGRIATQLAAGDAALPIEGVVLLGYPLHPPGRPDQRRDAHLPSVRHPMLFVQGTRDTFGTVNEMEPVVATLERATLHPVEGGDHSFKLARKNPDAQAAVYEDVNRTVAAWIYRLFSKTSPVGEKP